MTVRSASFDFDGLPPASVRGNSRVNWRTKARAVRALRETGAARGMAWRGLNATLRPPYIMSVRFRMRRRVDLDNLAIGLKGLIDGLQEAGVITDDKEIRELHVYGAHIRKPDTDGFTLVLSETGG